MTTKAHFDIVGSFLRPEPLKAARNDYYEKHAITRDQLIAVENQEIEKLVKKEIEAGLKTVTDGEFRRSYWHLDTFWGFDGIEHTHQEHGYRFNGIETRDDSCQVSGKIKFNPNHPDLAAFKFLKKLVANHPEITPRQSVPSPAQLYAELVRGPENLAALHKYYPEEKDLIQDIGKAYHDLFIALYEAGCRDIKIDDCTWTINAQSTKFNDNRGDVNSLQKLYLQFNNEALKNLPSDLTISTHVCRGNYDSTWATSGGYEPVAKTLFGKENVDNYYLEFDDDRSGDFQPLQEVSAGKSVVIGLVTSKKPELEDKQVLKNRIKEASRLVPLDRLALSTQCGFASTEEGNRLTEQQQWDKIRLVVETAQEVWG
ncbi:5-methyltetrahydropteroyltriglutamate--homocysteine S-methyltransferase [Fructilactobacillus vespulae]|uniref:5-methyltetrahydropteroyltriglutamate-- homocysteine S-methyltransferase n=1 Tax=Fructilactobacillus vespulae TaxID=1249630 RepID=UPI0039B37E52